MKHVYLLRSFSAWAVVLIIVVNVWIKLNVKAWQNGKVIEWDIVDYYDYLPALFIHHDWTLNFIRQNESYYYNNHLYWPKRTPEGKYVIKMSAGLAYLYLPFFLIAHAEAWLCEYPMDGFSLPYHKWIYFSALLYFLVGLIFLRRLLLRFFDDIIVAVTLLAIALGTNLLYYSAHESAMSHVYTFSLFSVFMWLWIEWLENPSFVKAWIIGGISGLIILIRPINVLFLLFPLFYKISTFGELRTRVIFFIHHIKQALLMGAMALIVWMPQLYYWHLNTGDWFYWSYENERFYFDRPQIVNGLWSYRKGWLLYNPLMYLSFTGIFFIFKRHFTFFWVYVILLCIYIYAVFSWWCWWYGGSYGGRAMIDLYPLLSLSIAANINFLIRSKLPRYARNAIVSLFLVAVVGWNSLQIIQYRSTFLHYDSMTKDAYWYLFGKPYVTDTAYWKLMKAPDYNKALRGEEEYP